MAVKIDNFQLIFFSIILIFAKNIDIYLFIVI